MERKAAKELLHIDGWLDRSVQIVERGKDAYLADDLRQEAGDSLMMKLGEAANRLSRLDVLAPDGVEWALAVVNRNFHPPSVRPDQPRAEAGRSHQLASAGNPIRSSQGMHSLSVEDYVCVRSDGWQ